MIAGIAGRIGIVVLVGVAAYGKGYFHGDGNGYDRRTAEVNTDTEDANQENAKLDTDVTEGEAAELARFREAERLRGKAIYKITEADLRARR